MEENMSDDDSREEINLDTQNNEKTDSKRMRIDNNCLNKSEESSCSSSNTTEQETASTSTDSGFPKSRNSRNRNYRTHSQGDPNANDSGDESPERRAAPVDDGTRTTTAGGGDRAADRIEWQFVVQEEDEEGLEEEEEEENIADSLLLSPDPASSNSTVINDTDTEESDDGHPTLEKEQPRHVWRLVPELFQRQVGRAGRVPAGELFRARCCGALRNVQRLELMYKLDEHAGCVNSLNFHPDGTLLASGSDDLKIVLWDWRIGRAVLKYDSKHKQNVFQSKFLHLSGDLHIASCARDGQVRIAQVSREEGLRDNRKLGCHRGPCNKLAVIADQPHLVLSAGEDGCVLSHDLRQPKPERIVTVKYDDINLALYSIDAHPLNTFEFCVSGRDETVRAYDQRKTNSPLHTYHPFKLINSKPIPNFHVTSAVYNYSGSEILASYSDEDIYLYDVNAPPGNYLHQYQGHRNGATIKGVNFFGPKSEFIVSGSDCGNLFFWEKNTEAVVNWMLADDNGVVNCLEPHPSLPFICTSGLDSDVKVWVPSCEKDPDMSELPDLLKRNRTASADFRATADMNESQMLWMLWRRLRNSYRSDSLGRMVESQMDEPLSRSSSSGSSSDTDLTQNDDEDSDDDQDGPSGCTTS